MSGLPATLFRPLGASLLAVALLVGACSNRPAPASPAPAAGATDGHWFCQMNADGTGWDCVQDEALAAHPEPQRLPVAADAQDPEDNLGGLPESAPGAAPAGAPEDWREAAGPSGAIAATQPPTTNGDVPAPPSQGFTAEPDEDTALGAATATPEGDLPAYLRLAYPAAASTAVRDLPGSLYAVQLLAADDSAPLNRYADALGVDGTSIEKVERDGAVYYVLLLGIYEHQKDAEEAIASLPAVDAAPWIRPVGSLKSAIARAEDLDDPAAASRPTDAPADPQG